MIIPAMNMLWKSPFLDTDSDGSREGYLNRLKLVFVKTSSNFNVFHCCSGV